MAFNDLYSFDLEKGVTSIDLYRNNWSLYYIDLILKNKLNIMNQKYYLDFVALLFWKTNISCFNEFSVLGEIVSII